MMIADNQTWPRPALASAPSDVPSAASLAIDNARLRGIIERFIREYVVCPDDTAVVCPVLEGARTEMRAALSSTPDAMVERVRRVIGLLISMVEGGESMTTKAWEDIDTLLREIGGKA
jgi:hypothetical protein